jgi:hypothetical protein
MGHLAAEGPLKVSCSRADTLLAAGQIEAPDVIKIDVEGAEADVLRGACGAMEHRPCSWRRMARPCTGPALSGSRAPAIRSVHLTAGRLRARTRSWRSPQLSFRLLPPGFGVPAARERNAESELEASMGRSCTSATMWPL